jgi:hypothetical protein
MSSSASFTNSTSKSAPALTLTSQKTRLELTNLYKRRDKNHHKRMKNLEKRVGEVSIDQYLMSFNRLKIDDYRDQSMKQRDKNIIELYQIQQDRLDFGQEDDMNDI